MRPLEVLQEALRVEHARQLELAPAFQRPHLARCHSSQRGRLAAVLANGLERNGRTAEIFCAVYMLEAWLEAWPDAGEDGAA